MPRFIILRRRMLSRVFHAVLSKVMGLYDPFRFGSLFGFSMRRMTPSVQPLGMVLASRHMLYSSRSAWSPSAGNHSNRSIGMSSRPPCFPFFCLMSAAVSSFISMVLFRGLTNILAAPRSLLTSFSIPSLCSWFSGPLYSPIFWKCEIISSSLNVVVVSSALGFWAVLGWRAIPFILRSMCFFTLRIWMSSFSVAILRCVRLCSFDLVPFMSNLAIFESLSSLSFSAPLFLGGWSASTDSFIPVRIASHLSSVVGMWPRGGRYTLSNRLWYASIPSIVAPRTRFRLVRGFTSWGCLLFSCHVMSVLTRIRRWSDRSGVVSTTSIPFIHPFSSVEMNIKSIKAPLLWVPFASEGRNGTITMPCCSAIVWSSGRRRSLVDLSFFSSPVSSIHPTLKSASIIL
eukprot:Lithocolla_globosa_v1_NODE_132_length_5923_cov_39.615883.p2 type:complete len:400 gc:universal NODE_132_length_5923_cov_39.615883:1072-2271(+)